MPTLKPAARVAVIGAGPSGAIAVDALVQESRFASIRVFERHEGPGGCWFVIFPLFPIFPHPLRISLRLLTPPPPFTRIGDTSPPRPLENLSAIAARSADTPLPIPATLPARTPRATQARFAESSIYPYLETNVDDGAMSFTGGGPEAIPAQRSEWSVAMHGKDTPFRHWTVMRDYVAALFGRKGYGALVAYGASVERAVKDGEEWVLTVRREEKDGGEDVWSEERFDAVVVASGHFNVPWVPAIEGLEEFEKTRTGSVLHSKMFRGREAFRGKVSLCFYCSLSYHDSSALR